MNIQNYQKWPIFASHEFTQRGIGKTKEKHQNTFSIQKLKGHLAESFNFERGNIQNKKILNIS